MQPKNQVPYISHVPYMSILTKYCSGDQVEKDEMSWARSTFGGDQRCIEGFGGETWGKETT